jgi:hypothetical protein
MNADEIRQYVIEQYVRPAQGRGEKTVSVTAGEVQKALGLKNRIAWVCTALRADRFQSENHLRLIAETGPPSGMSTTVKFTFEMAPACAPELNPLWQLRGRAKDMFEKLGEWEEVIKQERQQFSDVPDKTGR